MDFSIYSIEQLAEKQTKKDECFALDYNSYKGSGKAWIAIIEEKTKKKLSFLDCENNEKSGYKGTKHFNVPLTEGVCYMFNEEGTKSYDSQYYKKVEGGKLVDFK